MLTYLLVFFAGMVIGVTIGIFFLSLAVAAGDADDRAGYE